MINEAREIEIKFERAVKACQFSRIVSLSKPYMNETSEGYDSAYTNHMLWGYVIALNEFKK